MLEISKEDKIGSGMEKGQKKRRDLEDLASSDVNVGGKKVCPKTFQQAKTICMQSLTLN